MSKEEESIDWKVELIDQKVDKLLENKKKQKQEKITFFVVIKVQPKE